MVSFAPMKSMLSVKQQVANFCRLGVAAWVFGVYVTWRLKRHDLSVPGWATWSDTVNHGTLSVAALVVIGALVLSLILAKLLNRPWALAFDPISRLSQPLLLFGLAPLTERWFLNQLEDVIVIGAGLWVVVLSKAEFRSAPRLMAWFTLRQDRILSAPHKLSLAIAGFSLVVPTLYTLEFFEPRRHPVGDEPSYLTIMHSMVFDHDIIMENNYLAKDYKRYYSGIYPMFSHFGKDGHNYPHHSIGLPLMLSPAYWLGSHFSDAWLCKTVRLAMALFYGILAYLLMRLLLLLAIPPTIGLLAALIGLHSSPLLFYSTEIYPEIPAGIALIGCLIVFLRGLRKWTDSLLIGVGVWILPWLGVKYLALSLALVVMWGIVMVRSPAKLKQAVGLAAASVPLGGAYLGFLYKLYGNFSPISIYNGVSPYTLEHSVSLQSTVQEFFSGFHEGLRHLAEFWLGAFLEQRVGLFILAPVFSYALWGIMVLVVKRPSTAVILLSPLVVYLSNYGYQANWGGFCPPNRPIITVLPLVIVFLAVGMSCLKRAVHRALFPVVVGLSGLVSITFLYHNRWLYHTMIFYLEGGYATLLHNLSMPYGVYLPDYFPLIMGGIKHPTANLVWTLFLFSLIGGLLLYALVSKLTCSELSSVPLLPRSKVSRFIAVAGVALGVLGYRYWSIPGDRFRVAMPSEAGEYGLYCWGGGVYAPELDGFWIKSGTKTRLLLEFKQRPTQFKLAGHSIIDNELRIYTEKTVKRYKKKGNERLQVELSPPHIERRDGYYYVKLEVGAATGVQPLTLDSNSEDDRDLGFFLKLTPQFKD